MRAFGKSPATYEDLKALPPTMVGELVAGELVASPRPSMGHGNVAGGLTAALWDPFRFGERGPGGWWLFPEPELHLGTDVLVPDLAGWRRDRVPTMPNTPFVEIAPDWVCEILSRSTASFDRMRKMPVYLRERVGHVWLINPPHRTLEVYRHEDGRWVAAGVFGQDQVARIEPFDAVELNLAKLWLD